MTPLVASMASLTGDESVEFHWFDMGDVSAEIESDEPLLHSPLPYDKVALCGVDADGHKFIVQVVQASNEPNHRILLMYGFVLQKDKYEKIPMLRISIINNEIVDCVDADTELKQTTAVVSCGILTDFLGRLEKSAQSSYVASKKVNHAKRARQGKILMFDWRTIEIAATRKGGEFLGGTHASPRQHDRRGHWRNVGTRLVWVKSCVVGDAIKGSVFKDYIV